MKRYISAILLLLIFIGIAACSDEPREFSIHEPGEYKGTEDPLLAEGEHEQLKDRFMKVQTDR
jgi:hypothetical protein